MNNFKEKHQESRNLFFKTLADLLCQELEWGNRLISSTEEKCGFVSNYSYVLFPDGISQIIKEFENWQDEQMLAILVKDPPQAKIRHQIQQALEIRLMRVISKPVIMAQNRLFLQPANIISGACCYTKTCDAIWRWAGDKSDDFNYYTKRGLLLCVYAPARMYYVSDESEDFAKTKEFIATSLDNIINIASFKNRIKWPNLEDVPIFRMFS